MKLHATAEGLIQFAASSLPMGERQLNVLKFCDYADALGVELTDLLRRVAG